MRTSHRLILAAVLVGAVAVVLVAKHRTPQADAPPAPIPAMPRLVDLGSATCVPCRMMTPILEELEREYGGTFEVDVIDVRENPRAGEPYGIRVIPTQIFYDAAGRELFRHEGFFGKQDILGVWKQYGVVTSTETGE